MTSRSDKMGEGSYNTVGSTHRAVNSRLKRTQKYEDQYNKTFESPGKRVSEYMSNNSFIANE